MKKSAHIKRIIGSLAAGLVVGLAAMLLTVSLANAAPPAQEATPTVPLEAQACTNCHTDITQSWANSSHAHAFDDDVFQERWHGLGEPGDCLLCHTTDYRATTGEFSAEGVACEACHGKVDQTHPLAPAPIRDDAEYCGTCHTTTLNEWRLTGHAHADVGCTDCHNPHSQKSKFENPDDMCLNCHKDDMGAYLEDTHVQKGIGCVDCHALVVPPEEEPVDGIVPTGHTFTITPATCVACHTDALHAGFSLPGYEHGAKAAAEAEANGETAATPEPKPTQEAFSHTPEEQIQTLRNQVETLQASNASRNMTVLFQGGVVGLVLGGSTAWVVSSNARRNQKEEEEAQAEDEGEQDGKEEAA